jgi:nicotinate-nucleotide adenylyltransferase
VSSTVSRVGLLTGTFDPVHLGHVSMAQAALKACELREVWFLVNPSPGHKQGVSELSDRLCMVRLAIAEVPNLREGEPGATEPSRHTMADFEMLMARHPKTEFVFIVGTDVLAAMSTWPEQPAEVVAHSVRFAAVQRPGVAMEARADLKVVWFKLSEHEEASSWRVRQEVQAGMVPTALNSSVYQYILEKGLYKA